MKEYIVTLDDSLKGWKDDEDELIRKYGAEERPVGHWIYNPRTDLADCSLCGGSCDHDVYGRIETDFCQTCGARMIGEDNGNNSK